MKTRNGKRGLAWLCIAIVLLTGKLDVSAQVDITSPSAILIEASTGEVIFEKDADAIDIALTNARNHVNRGLGEIIRDISLEGGTGGLSEKTAAFDDRVSDWMSFQFPLEDDGTIMELMSCT